MSAAVSIRPAVARDLPALADLERDGFACPWSTAALEPCLRGDDHLMLVAETAGELGGFVLFLRLPEEAELLRMAVASPLRGRGLGAELVRAGLDRLAGEGRPVCHLEVRASNRAAIHLYERLGFRLAGARPGYYADGEEARLYRREGAGPPPG